MPIGYQLPGNSIRPIGFNGDIYYYDKPPRREIKSEIKADYIAIQLLKYQASSS